MEVEVYNSGSSLLYMLCVPCVYMNHNKKENILDIKKRYPLKLKYKKNIGGGVFVAGDHMSG